VIKEAKCPYCLEWSAVEFDGIGHWWKKSGACPKCGAIVLVETECEFRVKATIYERLAAFCEQIAGFVNSKLNWRKRCQLEGTQKEPR